MKKQVGSLEFFIFFRPTGYFFLRKGYRVYRLKKGSLIDIGAITIGYEVKQ